MNNIYTVESFFAVPKMIGGVEERASSNLAVEAAAVSHSYPYQQKRLSRKN